MFTTTNAMHVLVAGNLARTTSASIDPNSANYLADGEVLVVDEAGTVLDTTSVLTKDEVRLVQRSGDELFWSPVVRASEIKRYIGSAYATDVEQLTYLGFNGTTGAIDVIADNDYLVRVIRQDIQATYMNKEMLKFGAYRTGASATQDEIATGLVTSLIANYSREPEREIKFERIHSDAGAAIAQTADPVYKSTLVVMSAANAFVAGDYVRFGTAVTDPVYKVASKSGDNLVLDVPFQGDSATGVTVERIDAAATTAGDFGIAMTGVPRKFKRGEFKFSKVRFEVTTDDFGSTDLTFDTAASEGNGTWESAQEMEWFASEGIHGKIERIGTPPPTSKLDVAQGNSFSTLYVSHADKSHSGIQGSPESKIETYVLLDKGTDGSLAFGDQVTGAGDNTSVVDVLDAWVAAKGVGSAQVSNL